MLSPTPSIESYRQKLAEYRQSAERNSRTVLGAPLESTTDCPLLSVITIAYNSAATIRQTIESVLAQSYPNLEYILIDGGSKDGTLDIIREYSDRLSYWHSGADRGISDAFNLGIAASAGSLVALVNADDWMGPEQAQLSVAGLITTGAAFVYGRLRIYDRHGNLRAMMRGDPKYWRSIRRGMPRVNHPSVVVRRAAYEAVGLFEVRRRIAMDYDWLLRAELLGIRGTYLEALEAHMRVGGVCSRDWTGGLREVRDAAIENGMSGFMANARLFWRIGRGYSREALQRVCPPSVTDLLHRIVNPRYSPVRGTHRE